MKILMVSMPSLHFFRWTEQLKNAGHDIYWFNVTDSGEYTKRIDWVNQCYGWRLKWDFPSRTRLKASLPKLNKFIERFNTNATDEAFENYLSQVKPDVVHSFALYMSCSPILKAMKKYPNLKWIYSSWGSDLFYYQNIPDYLKDIKEVLPRVQYLFTDCKRDYKIAKQYGFRGEFLGVYPGGGGFKLNSELAFKTSKDRQIILIKGFQGRSGRVTPVLKAIQHLNEELKAFHIVVFGADKTVKNYISKLDLQTWANFQIHERIKHKKVLELMQNARLYIGNSNSDGMPNTLLEAICFGAFPIQSNPGDATTEIIEDGVNGLLINDCEDVDHIRSLIKHALTDKILIDKAFDMNKKLRKSLDFDVIKNQVLDKYQYVKGNL